jgi:hypothetical protein
LLALIRYSASEDLSYLNEFEANKIDVFSPDYDYSLKIIEELYRARLIAINPISDLDTIELVEEGRFSFYLNRVKWLLPLQNDVHPSKFIEELEAKISSMKYVETSYDDVLALCKEISLKECLTYLEFVLAEHQLNFTPGEKTMLIINKALQNFSVAQMYNFIWRAGKDAAAFYLRSATSKKHAANIIPGNIERQIDRALANNWDITAFRRNYDIPQSTVSRVLFNSLLHTDDGGFSQVLCKII